jgi:hypothetical protein
MQIDFDDARKAVRRGARSATHAIDVAHDASRRGIRQAQATAGDVIDAGDHAQRMASGYARSAHDWMEEKPHLAAIAAFAAGILLGAVLRPRS